MMLVFLFKLYSFSIHTHTHKTRLNKVVDETTRGYGLGTKRLGGKRYWGAKRLIGVKKRGEMTRSKTTRGWGGGNVLGAKRLVTVQAGSITRI